MGGYFIDSFFFLSHWSVCFSQIYLLKTTSDFLLIWLWFPGLIYGRNCIQKRNHAPVSTVPLRHRWQLQEQGNRGFLKILFVLLELTILELCYYYLGTNGRYWDTMVKNLNPILKFKEGGRKVSSLWHNMKSIPVEVKGMDSMLICLSLPLP